MRITNTCLPGIAWDRSIPQRRPAVNRSGGLPEDYVALQSPASLSLPEMLQLTAPGHPQRETFLAALSESLRAGIGTSDPGVVAHFVLQRGFDSTEFGQ